MTFVSNPVGMPNILPPNMINPMVPYTIKIDVIPHNFPQVSQPVQPGVIYNVPQTSVFEPKKVEVKQDEKKVADTPKVENKKQEKTVESTMAEILAAQKGVKPQEKTENKAAEDKSEVNAEVKKNKPEIVKPEAMKTGIDLEGLLTILNSSDYEEQADAMEAMAEVATYAPEKAGEMLDSKVIDSLADIMNKDTSALNEKDKKLADRNKEYAMFTTATLQKLFSDEVKSMGNVDVPPKDLVGMEHIVKNLATNPNESVREAAVASLGYATNHNKQADVKSLLNAAADDISPIVRAQAGRQLAKA